MPHFRKKPVIISAVLWQGERAVLSEIVGEADWPRFEVLPSKALQIKTLEGDMRADLGDWVIRGVKGEYYPCKPGIFDATYDKA